jgi:hypothetical protein
MILLQFLMNTDFLENNLNATNCSTGKIFLVLIIKHYAMKTYVEVEV